MEQRHWGVGILPKPSQGLAVPTPMSSLWKGVQSEPDPRVGQEREGGQFCQLLLAWLGEARKVQPSTGDETPAVSIQRRNQNPSYSNHI
uniref:Uncharacterized protein n=1 Tax=Sphaerodactylus townsendi TaxID=933632 RepID=A0ACB8GC53_9SAUR